MLSSIYYGEIQSDKLVSWNENKDPYNILVENNRVYKLGGWEFLDIANKLFDNEKVMNATEYCDDCMGAASTMESVQYLLLGITLIVVLLVCILMERSFLADEKSQIAVLKAMGFGNRRVMEWHMTRFGIVTLVAVLLAAICSIPATYLIGNPIFGMMGAGKVAYVIRPWKIFFLYPGIIFLMTLLASGMTALQIRTIKSNDTTNIE